MEGADRKGVLTIMSWLVCERAIVILRYMDKRNRAKAREVIASANRIGETTTTGVLSGSSLSSKMIWGGIEFS